MAQASPTEIGILIYPGAQIAAVLGPAGADHSLTATSAFRSNS